jgi:hypothetical protein
MAFKPEMLESNEYSMRFREQFNEKFKNFTLDECIDACQLTLLEEDRKRGWILTYMDEGYTPLPEGWPERRYQELKAIVESRAAKAPGNPAYAGINGSSPDPQGGNGHGTGEGKSPDTGGGHGPGEGKSLGTGDCNGPREEKYKRVTLEERVDIKEFRALDDDSREGFRINFLDDDLKPVPEGRAEARYWDLKAIVGARAARDPGDPGNPAYAGVNGSSPDPGCGAGPGPGGGKAPGPGGPGGRGDG